MSRFGKTIQLRHLWLYLVCAAAGLFAVSFFSSRGFDSTNLSARRVGKITDKRIGILENFTARALAGDHSEWMSFDRLPEDMVVYRYVEDSLQSWSHQFSTPNDDIGTRFVITRFADQRNSLESPLVRVDTVWNFVSIGSKWYMARRAEDGEGCVVISGVEIKNGLDGSSINGVNPRLKLSERFSLYPLSFSGGAAAFVQGQPAFKIIRESNEAASALSDSPLLWLAIALMLAAILLCLYWRRSFGNLLLALCAIFVLLGAFYYSGTGLHVSSSLFSPTIYADGQVWRSLASLLIINLFIFSAVVALYIVRHEMATLVGRKGWTRVIYTIFLCLLLAFIIFHIHYSFSSIMLNSNISLEIHKIGTLTLRTSYVYLTYFFLFLCILLLIQSLSETLGLGWDLFSAECRLVFGVLVALYLVSASVALGNRKEKSRMEIWANSMAADRSLSFEIQLRNIEEAIANDPLIHSVLAVNDDYRVLLNRITEVYLSRVAQDYDLSLYMYREGQADADVLKAFNERFSRGKPITLGSRFLYSRTASGRPQYTGMFVYYTKGVGVTRLVLGLDSKTDRESRGYSALMGDSKGGSVAIPSIYSYGKYLDGKLVSFRGDFPYPTLFSGELKEKSDAGGGELLSGSYVHFVHSISNDEQVVISRQKVGFFRHLVPGILMVMLAYAIACIPTLGSRRRGAFEKNYYKSRINTLLMLSLIAVLVTLAVISVLFVYRRNRSNVTSVMAGRIPVVQSLVEASCRYFSSYEDFLGQEMTGVLGDIGEYLKSDVTLYATDGRVLRSTNSDVFERMLLGARMDEKAYKSIIYEHERYFIQREKMMGRPYYAMYVPIFNASGDMMAIACSPFVDSVLDFRQEAALHSIFIIAFFLVLLIVARLLSSRVVDKMFRPLIEMGAKMNAASTGGLEYIFYEREDEISTLVRAYNVMVHDLYESSKQIAQIERDKAWSEMARQVAHEIKNPLTPIKLQIQRIIRLRERNTPGWEEKLDSIVPVILSSIDTLTDTANEFSTFAKLYTQEPTLIDLDQLARDETNLFSERDDVTIEYMGLNGATVMGPKPQLTRVFVNLLTNAVQAVDAARKDDREQGLEPRHGRILLSIRHSLKEGYYDIVFEDNGAGVKDEDRGRLFTPNFTTKSGGTGLGLAICKNVLERCGGDIFYSRSFTLQGACFTIRFPRGNT